MMGISLAMVPMISEHYKNSNSNSKAILKFMRTVIAKVIITKRKKYMHKTRD